MWSALLKQIMADRERYALVSHLGILRSCPEVLTRLFRRGGSFLVAAKVLVLSRSLHKKLSNHPHISGYVEFLRERLTRLRRQLFARIDRRLGDFTVSRDGLVDAMSAFSLVTSSSTADVLRHFHHVRAEAMNTRTTNLQGKGTEVIEAFRHWVQTLHETQAIFPRHISSSLLKLKSMPLFSDPAIRSLIEFDYDNHEKWIGDEIKHFIPYLVHDNLQSRATSDLLTVWASKTFKMFLQNIDGLLGSMNDPNDIESLRRDCLELLISSRSYAVGANLAEIINDLRDAFNGRFLELIEARCEALAEVFSVIDESVRHSKFKAQKEPGTFWTSTIASIDTAPSEPHFIQDLQLSVTGNTYDVHSVTVSYRRWLSGVENLESISGRLRDTKWVEDLYDIDDEDNISEAIQALLSADDSETMHKELSSSVSKSLDSLQASTNRTTKDLDDDQEPGPKAALLLRFLRYARHNLPSVCAKHDFAVATIIALHTLLSKKVVESTLANHLDSMSKAMTRRRVPGRVLWYGSPELPVLPSPWCIQLLRGLHFAMANTGSDLWSPEAVTKLKSTLRTRLVSTISAPLGGVGGVNGYSMQDSDAAITNGGDISRAATEDVRQEASYPTAGGDNESKIQLFFDLMYLHWASASSGKVENGDSFYALCGRVAQDTGLAKAPITRIEASAGEYWKRTSLLFALLP